MIWASWSVCWPWTTLTRARCWPWTLPPLREWLFVLASLLDEGTIKLSTVGIQSWTAVFTASTWIQVGDMASCSHTKRVAKILSLSLGEGNLFAMVPTATERVEDGGAVSKKGSLWGLPDLLSTVGIKGYTPAVIQVGAMA